MRRPVRRAAIGQVVRIIRMVRVFRIFKMAKFSAGVSLIGETLLRSAPALSVLLITIGILVSPLTC